MPDVPPPQQNVIIVESAPSRAPLVMMGFYAAGPEGSLQKMEDAAQKIGVPNRRLPGQSAGDEIAVMFAPGSARAIDLGLYHDALQGRFGKLAIKVLVVPVAAYQEEGDVGDEARAVSPDFIMDPKS